MSITHGSHTASNVGCPSPSQVLVDSMTTWSDLLIFNRYANTLRQFSRPNGTRGERLREGRTNGERERQSVGIHYLNRLQSNHRASGRGRHRRRVDEGKATSAGTFTINLGEGKELAGAQKSISPFSRRGGARWRRPPSPELKYVRAEDRTGVEGERRRAGRD